MEFLCGREVYSGRMRLVTILLELVCISLTACSTLPISSRISSVSPTISVSIDKPMLTAIVDATPTPTQEPVPLVFTLWIPPQFDPRGESLAARLLMKRMDDFVAENPDVEIKVRIKALSGPASLIESLVATNAAAPPALPSLVLLPQTDLEVAVSKQLVFPLDQQLASTIDNPDWFSYARQLALIQGSTFGLPFAGDALILVYRSGQVASPSEGWQSVLRQGKVVSLPFADPQALVTLTLYRSLGGLITDEQGALMLQPEVLAQVFKFFADGNTQGIFPTWLIQNQTDAQAWQVYNDEVAQWLVTWSSRYLAEKPKGASAVPIPSLGTQPVSLCTGWLWALSDPIPERRGLAVKLAEYLVESQFMAEWSMAAGYLPTRPSALAAWQNQQLRSTFSQVVAIAQPKPANDQISILGPVLSDAALQVLKRQTGSGQAAQAAAERLNVTTNK
jgi:multiple sugar transport system substrate-binding protein